MQNAPSNTGKSKTCAEIVDVQSKISYVARNIKVRTSLFLSFKQKCPLPKLLGASINACKKAESRPNISF